MKYRGIIFDLDGTLLDTLADIAYAANAVLQQFQFATHPIENYRHYVGSGVVTLFERALPAEAVQPELLEKCKAAFLEAYEREWNARVKPYEGIPELLDTLTARELKMAVLSNKPHEFTVKCVEELLPDWHFNPVLGDRPGIPIKPDPQGANEIADAWQIPPEQCLYMGDTGVDMQTSNNAGMYAVGVAWGFRDRTELLAAGAQQILKDPADLLNIIDQ